MTPPASNPPPSNAQQHEPEGGSRQANPNLVRWVRKTVRVLSWTYLLMIIAAAVAFSVYGERSAFLGSLLYLPPQLWFLPGIPLTFLCLLIFKRLLPLQLLAYVIITYAFMGFRWSPASQSPKGTLTVLTNNQGEDNRQKLLPYLRQEDPDLVLLQDRRRGLALANEFPERFSDHWGEFAIISRFPIRRAGSISLRAGSPPVCVSWEATISSRPIKIYNVHLPTPRAELKGLVSPRVIPGLFFGRTEPLRQIQQKWDARVEVAERLLKEIEGEQLPYIVAGDFNMPPSGYLYRRFSSQLQDSFTIAGRGCGFTFPGTTRNPLSLFGPWLRIDYIFSSSKIRPIHSTVEPDRRSQHRSVLARYELEH